MKRLTLIIFSLGLMFFAYESKAQVDIGFHAGLSTPNNQINNVYNTDKFKDLGNIWREGSKIGYNIKVSARLTMVPVVDFVGALGFHRFPQTDIEVYDPDNPDSVLAVLNTTQNIVAFSAGVNFYVIQSTVGVYATGNLAYNYISNTVDYQKGDVSIPVSTLSPTDSRVGVGLGAGLDFDIELLKLNLEGTFNIINLIGKDPDEENKSFFSLDLGVYL